MTLERGGGVGILRSQLKCNRKPQWQTTPTPPSPTLAPPPTHAYTNNMNLTEAGTSGALPGDVPDEAGDSRQRHRQ
jgi:hypothetical protein